MGHPSSRLTRNRASRYADSTFWAHQFTTLMLRYEFVEPVG
jgi:hypothetical protein